MAKILLGHMSRRLPSLTSLRTFEAAARHLSFAKAAVELFVTPAAVGFQIKQLEEELGCTLFLRKHRAIELTERGRDLHANLGQTFETIQKAWDAAHEPVEAKVLKVSGPMKAMHRWILPAVAKSETKRSDLRISWDITKEIRDVSSGEVDLAIRWAGQPEGDLHWEPLLRTWFTPVMRPDVARYVETPADVLKGGLIGSEFVLDHGSGLSAWDAWFRINDLVPPRDFAVTCADTSSAVETAVATGHVAIAGSFLAQAELGSGQLVAPFDTAITPFSRFWLVCRKGLETTKEYEWFLSVLRDSATKLDRRLSAMRLFHPDGSRVAT